jgi:NAD(P)-dependent dehydrogenase (short-subunit alcohol dehydrogenase family)
MWTWAGGVSVITGGGGLLGRGLALAFAQQGMDIAVSDLNLEAAERVAAEVAALGRRAIAVATNVADPASVAALAERAWAEFGKVNLLCNNAGIALLRPYEQLTLADWNRVLGINLTGVIHGVQAFLPRMIAQGGHRHILNTASMSGVGLGDLRQLNAPYVTAKFAVVGLSETLAPTLAKHEIGVSVLCPGMTVKDPTQPLAFTMPSAEWYKHNLLSALEVARETVHGIEQNRLHIFPHRAGLGEVEERHARILEDFRQSGETSPPLSKA